MSDTVPVTPPEPEATKASEEPAAPTTPQTPSQPEAPVAAEDPAAVVEAPAVDEEAAAKAIAENDAAVDREMAGRTRRSFVKGGIAALVGASAWGWLISSRLDHGIHWPLRAGLRVNETFWRGLFGRHRLAQTFPTVDEDGPRANGSAGLADDVDPDWKLTVEGIEGAAAPLSFTLAEIQALPKVEMTTELKCIEGWSTVVKWGGARFQDFVAKYAPGQLKADGYVALETPDRGYYVGLEMASAMHPQTLLCYEMNGEPLEDEHGAPLRLVIPVKYGIKNLKRIGRIAFGKSRPRDYWAERGYDYYAGF